MKPYLTDLDLAIEYPNVCNSIMCLANESIFTLVHFLVERELERLVWLPAHEVIINSFRIFPLNVNRMKSKENLYIQISTSYLIRNDIHVLSNKKSK
jgi:hypothetical protein